MLARLLLFGALLLLLAGCQKQRAVSPPGDTTQSAAQAAGTPPTPPAAADTLRHITPAADTLATAAQPADSLAAAISALARAVSAYTEQVAQQAVKASPQVSLKDAGKTAQNLGLRVFWALVVLMITAFLVKGIGYVLERLSEKSAKQRLVYKRLVPIIRILVWSLAFFLILRGIFQLDATGLAAAAAAVGVAVGFASQDILRNIFGGILIIFDQPFQVGDKIAVGGTYGEVVSIGLRSTRIVTPDDNLVSVPNSQVVDGQVSNANAGELSLQVVTDLYLPGWVDEAQAKQIAYEAAAASKYVFLEKPIVVLVKDEFKETFLTHLKVKAYVLDPRYEFLLMSEVTERARVEFRKQGLLTPLHGARAYLDLTALPYQEGVSATKTVAGPPAAAEATRTDHPGSDATDS